MINCIIAGVFLARGKYNLLYASSPPLFVGEAARILSIIKHLPMVFEVRDLWPESAVALGELTNPRVISWATKLEEACYRKAVQVIVVTRGIYNRLIHRSIPKEKILVVPNGSNIDMFSFRVSERERIRLEMGLEGKFIAIYAGIHGIAQGLETIIETAFILQENSKIHFILIGDGPKKQFIVELAKKYNLPNLTLLSEKPREEIPAYLSASDIALVPLRNAEIFTSALPSKIFDAWACERPVLINIDGEARQIVENIRGGVFIPPEDPLKMAEALIELMDTPSELHTMGKNGRLYTEKNHSRKSLAISLISHLEKFAAK